MVGFISQIPIVLLFLLSAATFHKGIFCCNEKDRSALLIFKHDVVDHFNKLSSWSNEEDCCAWNGVQCDNITDRVTRLDLNQQYLEGEINLSLLEIEFLNYLDLSLNGFTALSLPPMLNQSLLTSSNIQYLDFSFNDDFHMDNLQWLSKFSSLKSLNLSQINLQNETNWLQTMAMHSSLLELRLASCHLTNISPSIKHVNFTSLVTLDLSGNYFDSELPLWLFNLNSHISHIDLSFNFLQGQIPKSLLSLPNLKSLRLNDNELNGSIPEWLGQHEHLQYLGLFENLFHGSIPSSLGNLSSLVDLGISSNFLSGNIPTSFGKLFNLKSLFIGGDSLSGVLSEKHFSNLSNLETLVLRSPFAFDLDSEWIPPFQLHSISLVNTILGHDFPSWIYTQQSLQILEVLNSRISSIDEDTFWSFVANVKHLNLQNNLISADLSNVTLNSELIFMDNNNNFTGRLPHVSPNVIFLGLSHNSLYGPISHLFCHKLDREYNLNYLDMSFNLLTGAVPDCWEYWKSLSFFMMQNNGLNGEIPPSMGSLIDLTILDLHNNNLSGNFSLDLSNMTNLEFINIERNKFSGIVPVVPHSMQMMILRSNQFEGNIPPHLCNLSSLIQLDLSHNKFSGPIPQCIGNFTSMGGEKQTIHYPFRFNMYTKGLQLNYKDIGFYRSLDLSTNNLSGEIPPEVFSLIQLKSLNLSRNHFTGKIPREIGDMKNLESLDLSNNQLFGEIPVTISSLSFLSFLNVSNNELIGQIPLGTQLQSFDASSYDGNPGLCGAPLLKNCISIENGDESKQLGENNDDEDDFTKSLYLGMGVGFAVGFWGICGSIFFNSTWRHTYFRFLNHVAAVANYKFNSFSGMRGTSN